MSQKNSLVEKFIQEKSKMAIKTVKATLNGSTYNLTYDSSLGAWTATLTAPGSTSFNKTGGYYDVAITATNDAGTQTVANASNNNNCKLVVKETVKPVITIIAPTSGAYTVNNKQPISFTVVDEAGGSGVKSSTISVNIDGTAITDIKTTAITNGYSVTATPATALSDGSHTVTINVSDNDGNAAEAKSTTFTVDTVPPTLNVTSPTEGLITASSTITVSGTTNDVTSSPTTVTVNGTKVTVASNGTFSTTVTLKEGSNTITIIATDAAGKTTTVTRKVTLNTAVPEIKSVTIAPNPANTGASMIIKVVVEE